MKGNNEAKRNVLLPRCLQYPGLNQAVATSLELNPPIHVVAGTQVLEPPSLDSQSVHYQEAGLVVEEPVLEPGTLI